MKKNDNINRCHISSSRAKKKGKKKKGTTKTPEHEVLLHRTPKEITEIYSQFSKSKRRKNGETKPLLSITEQWSQSPAPSCPVAYATPYLAD